MSNFACDYFHFTISSSYWNFDFRINLSIFFGHEIEINIFQTLCRLNRFWVEKKLYSIYQKGLVHSTYLWYYKMFTISVPIGAHAANKKRSCNILVVKRRLDKACQMIWVKFFSTQTLKVETQFSKKKTFQSRILFHT